jgi:hypothetical protein
MVGRNYQMKNENKNIIQNGKGDAPRNISKKFRDNYDLINWGNKKENKKKLCTQR